MFRSLHVRNLKNKVRYHHYVSVHELHPAQLRCSRKNVLEVAEKMLKTAVIKNPDNTYSYKYENGTSLNIEPFHVVLTPFVDKKYLLTDGHHDMSAGLHISEKLCLKAPMIPVKVIGDLRHLDTDSFWQEAKRNNWAYLNDLNQKEGIPPKSFADLVDDPNRYFASITARRYFLAENGTVTSDGLIYPLWLKKMWQKKQNSFIEFRISDALIKNGFIYDVDKYGNLPPIDVIQEARAILLLSNIEGLCIPRVRAHFSEININEVELPANRVVFKNR